MRFDDDLRSRFDCEDGAFSLVTPREVHDSQITLTDYEYDLVVSHFGIANIHVGNVRSDPIKSSKTFRLYSDDSKISLNLVFPKPGKDELRLYLSSKAGFKPDAKSIWFLYRKRGEIWLGSMPLYEWSSTGFPLTSDESDSVYQLGLAESNFARIATLRSRDVFVRDRNIALKKMEIVGYVCEFDPSHSLFISKATGKPYVEAHHLVPMGAQSLFEVSLDTLENVCCLCPSCHRAIHLAEDAIAKPIIEKLARQSLVMENLQIDIDQLLAMYGIG